MSSTFVLEPPALDCYQVHRRYRIMQTGIIAGLTDKGFGFIKIEGREKDLFFHSNELTNVKFDDLRQGDKMEFEIEEGEKGPKAVRVSKI
jgi:cold shock protein